MPPTDHPAPQSSPRTLYITANSPGEISGFLVPVVRAVREHLPHLRVAVILLPCTFATGQEEAVASAIHGVDRVIPTRDVWRHILHGPPEPAAALVHLGGDLLYAALMAWRWKIPAWAYQWAQRKWDRFLAGYFVKTEADATRLRRQRISAERIHVVGDLVVDAVRSTLQAASPDPVPPFGYDILAGAPPHVVYMPGSRLTEFRLLTPFLLEVSDRVASKHAGARFSLLVSPYLPHDAILRALESRPDSKVGGVQGRLASGRGALVSPSGTSLALVEQHPLLTLATADVVVSLPGTKTGEAGALARPTLVILPFNRPDVVPWFGLLGLLDLIPFVGARLKGWLLWHLLHDRVGLVGQPNILAGRELVPELKAWLTPDDVAKGVLALIDEPAVALRMREGLMELYRPFEGAADRAVAVVAERISEITASGRGGAR